MHITPQTCRPGERLVAGRPYCFNMRLVAEHDARVRVSANDGADLTAKPLSELALLISDCRALFYEPDYPEDFHRRLVAERARRNVDTGGALISMVA